MIIAIIGIIIGLVLFLRRDPPAVSRHHFTTPEGTAASIAFKGIDEAGLCQAERTLNVWALEHLNATVTPALYHALEKELRPLNATVITLTFKHPAQPPHEPTLAERMASKLKEKVEGAGGLYNASKDMPIPDIQGMNRPLKDYVDGYVKRSITDLFENPDHIS